VRTLLKFIHNVIKTFKNNPNKSNHSRKFTLKQNNSETLAYTFVSYLNEKGQSLKPYDTIQGYLGQKIDFTIPDFKSYVITDIEGNLTEIKHPKNWVTIHYMSLNAKPINVFFINYDTYSMIQMPETYIGKYGDAYKIKPPTIPNFITINHIGNLTGRFSDNIKNIIIYYRRDDWKCYINLHNSYIRTTHKTKVYLDTPGKALDVLLPAATTWKVFYTVQSHGIKWLNIGFNQWIVDQNYKKIHYPFATSLVNATNWQHHRQSYSAIIKANYWVSVPVYNYPYGSCLYLLHPNDQFNVTNRIIDDNDNIWLEINNLYFISDRYVQKKE
jgi:hypothetical protein